MITLMLCVAPFVFLCGSALGLDQTAVVEGLTFPSNPGRILVPLREIVLALSVKLEYDADSKETRVAGKPITDFGPSLFDGTRLISARAVKDWGFDIEFDAESGSVRILRSSHERQPDGSISVTAEVVAEIPVGPKRAVVDKQTQELLAFQGERIVFRTNISTGGRGHTTPNGDFSARAKYKMHYSSLYENSPMPWSVQVNGNIFIHGYHSVPKRPASHGCVRVPIKGKNPAKWFFDWVEPGTPITIEGDWKGLRAAFSRP